MINLIKKYNLGRNLILLFLNYILIIFIIFFVSSILAMHMQ
jgi:hypothetical protein